MTPISIIIPTYNPGPYLELAVQSIVAQTFTDWELVIVDDGSQQDVSGITALHPSIRIIRQANQGQAIARNVGIVNTAGEYVAFLDQDDLWNPSKLEAQFAVMQADAQIALCHTQFDIIDESDKRLGAGFGRQQTYLEMLEGSGICGASSVLVRREQLLSCGLFDRFCQPAEDYDLWLRLSYRHKTQFVPSCEVRYRQHSQNQSLRYRESYRCIATILEKHSRYAETRGDQAAVEAGRRGQKGIRQTYGGQAYDHCRRSLRQKEFKLFLNHLAFAFCHAPWYVTRAVWSHVARRVPGA